MKAVIKHKCCLKMSHLGVQKSVCAQTGCAAASSFIYTPSTLVVDGGQKQTALKSQACGLLNRHVCKSRVCGGGERGEDTERALQDEAGPKKVVSVVC